MLANTLLKNDSPPCNEAGKYKNFISTINGEKKKQVIVQGHLTYRKEDYICCTSASIRQILGLRLQNTHLDT